MMHVRGDMKKLGLVMACVGSLAVAIGCGGNGASNNDQGVSVTFLGLFVGAPTPNDNQAAGPNVAQGNMGCSQMPNGLSGGYMTLGSIGSVPPSPIPGFVGLPQDPAGTLYSTIGVQNNMYGQFFRADRLLLEYYVPGASVQPPSTNVAVNFLVGPAESSQMAPGANGAGASTSGGGLRRPVVTSLPPSFAQVCNRTYVPTAIIPSAVREWLNFNRGQLPQAPFDLEIIMTISGLSSSGNRYETNAGMITLTVVDEISVEPPSGTATPGSSFGGTPTPVSTSVGGLSTLENSEGEGVEVESGDSQEDSLNAVFDTAVLVDGEGGE